MIQQAPHPSISAIANPILSSLKEQGIMESVIARAVSDRIIDTAKQIGESARQEIEEIDWVREILRSVEGQGFSEGLQERLDELGALGEVVSLRIQLALITYTNELATLKEEAQKLQDIEGETKKITLEKRYEIRRNAMLTRMQWFLTIFSLWPAVCLIVLSVAIGFAWGAITVQNAQNNVHSIEVK
jgi:hypothetical protein